MQHRHHPCITRRHRQEENSKQNQPPQKEPQRVDREKVRLQVKELLKLAKEVDEMSGKLQLAEFEAEQRKLRNAKDAKP